MTRVELLWWEGCPSMARARSELREAMAAAGLDPDALEEREISTDGAAEDDDFVGSPTVRVDGADIAPPPAGEPRGLACRVYHRRDGRVAPTPDPADLKEALDASR